MNYTVLWVPAAEQELAAIWMSAPDRNAVTAAAHAIDARLRTDPEEQGESRTRGHRILIESPLSVRFLVQPQSQTVFVLAVWRFETHPRPS
jgi:hypothetical protein